MTKKITPFMTVMFTVAFLFSLCTTPLMAQDTVKGSAKAERERIGKIMSPGANVEEFRQEYINYLTEFEDTLRLYKEIPAARKILAQKGLGSNSMLAEAKSSIAEMSSEELMKIRAAYEKFPGWREAPRAAQSLINLELRKRIELRLEAKENGVQMDAVITDDCAAARSVSPSNADIAVLQAAFYAAETASSVVPAPLNIALGAVAVTANGFLITAEALKATVDDCDGNDFQTAIQTQLTNSVANDDANTAEILTSVSNAQTAIINNDNTNKDTIVANDNTNRDTIITAVNDAKTAIIVNANANKEELIKLHIAADLASTDGAVLVGAFMLPAARGGYLELVRMVVVNAITNLAGSSASQANSQLAQGDAFKNAGDYKNAYTYYRRAYKTATK